MPFLAFSERLAALYTKIFAPAARKIIVLSQSSAVPGELSPGHLKILENKGVLITGGFLISISTDMILEPAPQGMGAPKACGWQTHERYFKTL